MKKASNSATTGTTQAAPKVRAGYLKNHDHVHATNCGHKSYVHGNHVDYECEGHYHYVENGMTYECTGPNAKELPFPKKK